MRHAIAAVILSASLPAWSDQAVTFTARDAGFAVSSTASGSVRKEGPFLEVTLASHTMRQGQEFKAPTKVLEYRVGLARNDKGGQWSIERWSAVMPADFTLTPGDTRQLPRTTALIPIENLASLRDSWLVVQIKVERQGGLGTTYSHSTRLVAD